MKNNYDAIIIGSGIAGLTVALSLPTQFKILIVTKARLADGATQLAQGGIAAVMEKKDSVAAHIKDTLEAGDYHNNIAAVSLLSKKSRAAVLWLKSLGVPFALNKDKSIITSLEAAHSYPRIVHTSDFTGRDIESTLIRQILNKSNICILETTMVFKLLVRERQCYGVEFFAKKRIGTATGDCIALATGGAGQIYQWTTNPTTATGDGIALAKQAGAKLADMEFVQFHPTALKHGVSPLFLLSERLRGEGGYLVDEKKSRFVDELLPRDELTRAIFEKQKTSTVYLTMSHLEHRQIIIKFPNIYKHLKSVGFDLTRDNIPITPAAHYLCGGVATDLNGQTSINNLYAVGECATTGVHGANRLASNSLLEGVVFGKRVAHHIDNVLTGGSQINPLQSQIQPRELNRAIKRPIDKKIISVLKKRLQELMWVNVGVIRTAKGLKTALSKIKDLQLEYRLSLGNSYSKESIELINMIKVATIITNVALKRKKNLGAHYRSN